AVASIPAALSAAAARSDMGTASGASAAVEPIAVSASSPATYGGATRYHACGPLGIHVMMASRSVDDCAPSQKRRGCRRTNSRLIAAIAIAKNSTARIQNVDMSISLPSSSAERENRVRLDYVDAASGRAISRNDTPRRSRNMRLGALTTRTNTLPHDTQRATEPAACR